MIESCIIKRFIKITKGREVRLPKKHLFNKSKTLIFCCIVLFAFIFAVSTAGIIQKAEKKHAENISAKVQVSSYVAQDNQPTAKREQKKEQKQFTSLSQSSEDASEQESLSSNKNNTKEEQTLGDQIKFKSLSNPKLPVCQSSGTNFAITEDGLYKYCYDDSFKGIEILEYLGQDTHVHIPSMIEETQVVVIGKNAFKEKGIESVNFPNTIKVIKREAFYKNNLITLTLPNELLYIEPSGFEKNKIKSVYFNEKLNNIGHSAFKDNQIEFLSLNKGGQSNLTITEHAFAINKIRNLEISKSVRDIRFGAFYQNPIVSVKIEDAKVQEGYPYSQFSIPNILYTSLPSLKRVIFLEDVNNPQVLFERNDDYFQYFKYNYPVYIYTASKNTNLINYISNSNGNYIFVDIDLLFDIELEPKDSKNPISPENVNVKISTKDGLNLKELKYKWSTSTQKPDDKEWITFNSNINYPTFIDHMKVAENIAGKMYLHLFVTDETGLEQHYVSSIFDVDSIKPTLEVDMKNDDNSGSYSNNTWTNKNVQVKVTASDKNSKLSKFEITLNGSTEHQEDFSSETVEDSSYQITFDKTGIYELSVTATDKAGNQTTETRTIKISKPDTLSLNTDFIQEDHTPYLIENWTNQNVTVSMSPLSKNSLKITKQSYSTDGTTWYDYQNSITFDKEGIYSLWFYIEDELGNTKTEKYDILIDKKPPEITLNGDTNMTIYHGGTFVDPGYVATDNLDSNIQNKVTVTGSVNTFQTGTYEIEYSVTDHAGNTATSVKRTVRVIDYNPSNYQPPVIQPPVITLNGDRVIKIGIGTPYEELGAMAIENSDKDLSKKIIISGNVNTSKVGTYIIRYTVTDSSGNKAEAVRTVYVTPTIDVQNVTVKNHYGTEDVMIFKNLEKA